MYSYRAEPCADANYHTELAQGVAALLQSHWNCVYFTIFFPSRRISTPRCNVLRSRRTVKQEKENAFSIKLSFVSPSQPLLTSSNGRHGREPVFSDESGG